MTALRFHSSKAHGQWQAPVGSAAHEYKWGRILPMADEDRLFWQLRKERAR